MTILHRYFALDEAGSSIRGEVRGGVTTFLAMAYILFVQPAFLGAAGMDPGAVLAATCLSSALATLVMGLWARYPVALAPGMGLNAFFAFTVCGAMQIPWQQALALVLTSGSLFAILGIVGLREHIVALVPDGIKHGIAAGIGLFIAFIGMKEAGLIEPDANTFVHVGDLGERWRPVLTAGAGFFVAAMLTVRKVPGAILLGILTSLAVALITGVASYQGVFSAPPSLAPTAFQFDLRALLTPTHLGLVLLFLYTDLFDTVGTLVGVATQANLLRDGQLPRGNRAFLADALGTITGGLLGTSTVTSYIESTAGVEAGGRTGLSSVVTGLLFLVALFLYPLVETVGGGFPVQSTLVTSNGGPPSFQTHTYLVHPVTAPALLLVGALMARSLGAIRWRDPLEGIPAFLVVAGIPLTFSIADGISLGLIASSGLAIAAGRTREVPWPLHLLAGVLLVRWVSEFLT
ncbi:MAG TPA: guanine permease [Deltaproteobacteria bacterium]|nr:guanine permease [Deltaproteobacteria bacterium]HCP46324.1 guanine permease [Deltaproteobacteria bacterium]|tara:strand:+ start:555 stop:1940 length:1386 start_codon:yes stop_codon:yes gene_type:complete